MLFHEQRVEGLGVQAAFAQPASIAGPVGHPGRDASRGSKRRAVDRRAVFESRVQMIDAAGRDQSAQRTLRELAKPARFQPQLVQHIETGWIHARRHPGGCPAD